MKKARQYGEPFFVDMQFFTIILPYLNFICWHNYFNGDYCTIFNGSFQCKSEFIDTVPDGFYNTAKKDLNIMWNGLKNWWSAIKK